MLKLKSVSKSFEDLVVVTNISFDSKPGQVTALVGENGAGKSTLLKLIAGLLQPDEGAIYLNDEKVEGPKDKLVAGHEEIKLVYQDFELKPNMSVEENLNYALLGFDPVYKSQRVKEIIELCGIESFRKSDSSKLSGGQKQRVAIARALATEPEVILMDEPFSNLDTLTKQQLLLDTKHLAHETGTIIVLVTHDMRDAMEAADHMVILSPSGIVQSGSPQSIYEQPNSLTIAGYFGLITAFDSKELTELLPEFQITSKASYGIRAEDIKVTQNIDSPHEIVQLTFAGSYHKVLIQTTHKTIIAFDRSKQLVIGDRVSIQIAPTQVIAFSKS
ncbi:MAG: ABC transporter ATP-binding protein [Cyclobacteriaceae bacterium]